MADDLIFFCMHIIRPLWTRFRVIIILNFLLDNEVIRANLYAYKRILNRRPFMNKVYNYGKHGKVHRIRLQSLEQYGEFTLSWRRLFPRFSFLYGGLFYKRHRKHTPPRCVPPAVWIVAIDDVVMYGPMRVRVSELERQLNNGCM